MADLLAGWADAPVVEDPLKYLDRVYNHLPDDLAILRKFRRRNIASMAVHIGLNKYLMHETTHARYFILRAVRYQPRWLNKPWHTIYSFAFISACLKIGVAYYNATWNCKSGNLGIFSRGL